MTTASLTLFLRFPIITSVDIHWSYFGVCRSTMPIAVTNTASSEPVLSWSVHLARRSPVKAIVSLALVTAATAVGCALAGPYVALVVAVALVASLSDFLFPVRYVVTHDGASCKMLLKGSEIKWSNVKRCYVDNFGVKLSPLDRVSRVEAFRGVYLRFGDNENEVIETVKSLKDRHAELDSLGLSSIPGNRRESASTRTDLDPGSSPG